FLRGDMRGVNGLPFRAIFGMDRKSPNPIGPVAEGGSWPKAADLQEPRRDIELSRLEIPLGVATLRCGKRAAIALFGAPQRTEHLPGGARGHRLRALDGDACQMNEWLQAVLQLVRGLARLAEVGLEDAEQLAVPSFDRRQPARAQAVSQCEFAIFGRPPRVGNDV